jgi:MbtH protein
MTNAFEDENGQHCVIVNDEGQYSLWPTFKNVPARWSTVGPRGSRRDCLEYIEKHWTDMRPKTLIKQMERDAAAQATKIATH